MIPAYTRRVVRANVEGYSILLATSGVGATLGAIVVASLGAHRRKDRWAIGGMILFAAFMVGAAVLPPMIGLESWAFARIWAAAACLLGMGFGAVVFYASCLTVIQLDVPDHLRGRIMGIWMIVYSGSVPLGSLWIGWAAMTWGVATILALSAVLCIAVGLIVQASGVLSPPSSGKKSLDDLDLPTL
jgi:MFS family permease